MTEMSIKAMLQEISCEQKQELILLISALISEREPKAIPDPAHRNNL